MELYENKYGFSIRSIDKIPFIDATSVEMIHEKSGARLIYLDRRDENTTFCIAFKTPPTDDTGVFHILEHSVLCGSKKFPIKDPFNELIKGSLSTYLNALTSGDKTLYPVSSKNAKSFRGLVDVYLDAVFNPLALENPYIFMQEGHRYEFDEDGDLIITGVVYNEMQGVYSTADDYADYYISRQLQPGGTYSYESGGHPDFIPDLTYEQFKEAHKKYYHPSNSIIFLDGDVNLDEILPLIDSYLKEYNRCEIDFPITDGDSIVTEAVHETYPLEEDEDPTDKTRVYLAYNTFDFHEGEKNSALSIICETLADRNTSPLTKRILETGLCESFSFYNTSNLKTNALHVSFIGVKDGKEEELIAKYNEILTDIINEGLSRDTMYACLKRREFAAKESDSGTYPLGMVYMRICINNAMFDEPITDAFTYDNLFSFLYEKLDTDYYLDALRESLSTAPATLILHPDTDFAEKRFNALSEKLDAIQDSMSEDEKAELIAESEAFHKWQSTPDTKENLDTLPTLSLSDINPDVNPIPCEVVDAGGTDVVLHPLNTRGITYTDMYFDVSDATSEDIHYLRLFCDMNGSWDTEKSNVQQFRAKIKLHLGSFYVTLVPILRGDTAKLYLLLHHSCLESEKENALAVIDEYLHDVRYDNEETVKTFVKQSHTSSLEGLSTYGTSVASIRTAAKYHSYGALSEHIIGFEQNLFIRDLSRTVDEKAAEVLLRFKAIKDKYFRRERLLVGITENDGLDYAKKLISTVSDGGSKSGDCTVQPIERVNEAIAIPGSVSFAVTGSHTNTVCPKLYNGACIVYESLVSHELLWNEIRVKNGAYGTDYYLNPTGEFACTSYRDPTPAASIEYYARVPDEIDAFLDTSPILDKYIIGVFGENDTVTTPKSDGSLSTKRYLTGLTVEEVRKRRYDCLATTVEDLRRINESIREALKHATFTVVAPRSELEKIEGIDRILDIYS